MRPPFPQAIDSTLRSTYVSCGRKYELMYMNHWKPQSESVHLVAGAAFARGIEITRRAFHEHGLRHDLAVAEGVIALIRTYGDFEPFPGQENKHWLNMVRALDEYFLTYGLETDPVKPHLSGGKYAIEFTFALPLSLDLLHPESGDPILYTGRFDMLGDYLDGVWAVDEKTTSYLGKTWYNNWPLRSQLTGYVWAARESGFDCAGALIRGVALRKTGFDFADSPQPRPDWMIQRWRQQVIRDVRRMIENWREGYFDYALDNACTDYGGCTFQEICTSPHPDRWLEANFSRRVWNPLTHKETEWVPVTNLN